MNAESRAKAIVETWYQICKGMRGNERRDHLRGMITDSLEKAYSDGYLCAEKNSQLYVDTWPSSGDEGL